MIRYSLALARAESVFLRCITAVTLTIHTVIGCCLVHGDCHTASAEASTEAAHSEDCHGRHDDSGHEHLNAVSYHAHKFDHSPGGAPQHPHQDGHRCHGVRCVFVKLESQADQAADLSSSPLFARAGDEDASTIFSYVDAPRGSRIYLRQCVLLL